MSRKLLKVLALTLVLALMTTAFAYGAEVPADVKGQSYEEAVAALVEKGIITGDTDGSFNPESRLTRAQACIIVVKTMNPPVSDITGTATQSVPKSGFSDMSGYGWAEGYISYAVQKGVTNGYPDGTFKPGSYVTINELITMVLRAAGYTDEKLGGTWPSNYVSKATELGMFKGILAPLPQYATKWMAAQIDFNAIDKIEAANPVPGTPDQGTDQDKPSEIPNTANMTYANGSFNDTMTTYAGKTIAKNVTLYTYGKSKDYSSTMTLSKKLSDYRLDTVYKYKNVKTPAFYSMENNKITAIVLPMDVGFSGRAYGVINGIITTLNGDGDAVKGIETLTATREITWLGKKGLSSIPTSAEYIKGEIYEMNTSNGEVQSIYKAADPNHKGDVFDEISTNSAIFVHVDSYSDSVVKITTADGGALFAVKDNASVYVLDDINDTEYKAGSLSNIRTGVGIRAYDISDDDDLSADIIVIMKNL